MFLIDFQDHRIIALIVCLSIILVSIIVISIRFVIHNKKYKQEQENKVQEDEKIKEK